VGLIWLNVMVYTVGVNIRSNHPRLLSHSQWKASQGSQWNSRHALSHPKADACVWPDEFKSKFYLLCWLDFYRLEVWHLFCNCQKKG